VFIKLSALHLQWTVESLTTFGLLLSCF